MRPVGARKSWGRAKMGAESTGSGLDMECRGMEGKSNRRVILVSIVFRPNSGASLC